MGKGSNGMGLLAVGLPTSEFQGVWPGACISHAVAQPMQQ